MTTADAINTNEKTQLLSSYQNIHIKHTVSFEGDDTTKNHQDDDHTEVTNKEEQRLARMRMNKPLAAKTPNQ